MSLIPAVLSRVLQTERAALNALLALLLEEQHALVHGDIDRVASLAEGKAQSLFGLARAGAERQQLMVEHGFASDRQGIEAYLREQKLNAPELQTEWKQLLEQTRRAEQINSLNGTLIATRLRSTQQALSTLLGAARIPGTYTPEGGTVSFRAAHPRAVV